VNGKPLASERHLLADLKAGTNDEYESEYETDLEEDYDSDNSDITSIVDVES